MGCWAAKATIGRQGCLRGVAVATLTGQRGQPQEHASWPWQPPDGQGVVLEAAGPGHELLGVVRRVVEAAVVGAEVGQHEVGQLACRA